uniref:Nuclear cap-binding protein subunit 1 n=1 Tax=Aceria tosichella TaxID=561515 RepID=A0A6G1SGB3_9ACAR
MDYGMYEGERRGVRRAHSPDDYEEQQQQQQQQGDNSFRRGPPGGQWGAQRGGYNQPYHKRHRGDNYSHHYQQQASIDDRIALLGETGSRNVEIGNLARDIEADLNRNHDDDKIRRLTAKICRCIVSFPTRVGVYATLVAMISAKNYNVAVQIIETLHASYPVYLEAQKWQEALTIIQLLSGLINCKIIRPEALLSQFEFLLECTLEDNIPQARSDYFVYTVLSSLPYVAQELDSNENTKANFEKMLNTIEEYLSKRSKDHLNVIRVWMSDDSTVQMDYLDSLWVQIKNFRAYGWNETFLRKPYTDKEYMDIFNATVLPRDSPTFHIPSHNSSIVYPSPRIVFRVFEDDAAEGEIQIPGSDKIERFCIENHIRAIIDECSNDLKACSRHLRNMYHSEQLPMKHLLIETILGELFTLPRPKHDEILYHTLLFEFTKIFQGDLRAAINSKSADDQKNNYDIILNEAVKVLYDNLETMNTTCFTRFVNWFSFHLNNYKFVYPWQAWQDATCKEDSSPKAVFVRDILDRCVRFSFHKKINTLVEAHIANLMPQEVSVQYKPVFVDNPKAGEMAATIKKLIIEKADGETICRTLNIMIDTVKMPEDFVLREEKLSEKLLKVDIFTAVILDIASKSLTHLSSAIGKFRNVFKSLTKIPQGQIQLLQTMHSCLETHPQLQVILVDKLLKAELVEPIEVCNWIFSEPMKPFHIKSYLWEILNNTIVRVKNVIGRLVAQHEKSLENDDGKDDSSNPTNTKDTKVGKGDGEDEGGNTPDHDEPADVDMLPASQSQASNDDNKKEAARKEKELLHDKIEEARFAYKQLVLHVFRLFATVLEDHINTCAKFNASIMNPTYRWLTGRMQEVYYNQIDSVLEFYDEIKSLIEKTPSVSTVIVNLNR